MASTGLLTDHYELTALDAALCSGVAHHRAVFELFARHLPPGRRYGVVAGMSRVVDAIERFRFGDEELAHLERGGFLRPATLAWLAALRFGGDVRGYRDGELFFPGSPVLTVEATLGEALVLETLVLSILNHDAAVASAASRMAVTAAGRSTIDGGSRRTHEQAAVDAALAAHVGGIDRTSNLEAGRRHGIPTVGTTMHAFVLAHEDEVAAYRSQLTAMGPDTTYLVDTYDIAEGVRRAVEVVGPGIGGIRIDSGHLPTEAVRARQLLDSLGATGCRIVVSGDLDEHRIAELADCPVDAYMVGTRLVTGSGAPTAELVYKLVAVADGPGPDAPLRPVAKTSEGKGHVGGRKVATRLLDGSGRAVAERVLGPDDDRTPAPAPFRERPLQVDLFRAGQPVPPPSPRDAREHHRRALDELTDEQRSIAPGGPALVAGVALDPVATTP